MHNHLDIAHLGGGGFGFRAPVPIKHENDSFTILFGKYQSNSFAEIYSVKATISRNKNGFGPCDNVQLIPETQAIFASAGSPHTYSESGIIPSCFIQVKKKGYLFTIGFNSLNKFYFNAETGVISFDIDTLDKFEASQGPVLNRSQLDPYWAASPFIIYNKDVGVYHMFYTSAYDLIELNGSKIHHRYNIRERKSKEIDFWSDSRSRAIVNATTDSEYAIARPVVMQIENLFIMLYSKRETIYSENYLTFCAYSNDLINWSFIDSPFRIGNEDKNPCECYAYPFIKGEDIYIFYNSHGFGKSGAYVFHITIDKMKQWIKSEIG